MTRALTESVDDTDHGEAPVTITIRPWIDPLVDDTGHDPRSRYVEQFWLGVLGPTATWLLRRLATGLERSPEGYELDLGATARAMGMSYSPHRSSPFSKAVHRCTMFGLAHHLPNGLAVRRRVPTVALRHVRRMPPTLQQAHETWTRHVVGLDDLGRAHRLAMAMVESGDDALLVEHHLVAVGVHPAVAEQVADNVLELGRSGADAGEDTRSPRSGGDPVETPGLRGSGA